MAEWPSSHLLFGFGDPRPQGYLHKEGIEPLCFYSMKNSVEYLRKTVFFLYIGHSEYMT